MIERERSFDISKLAENEAEQLAIQIGNKVRGMVDEAAEKINSFLKIYGMSAKFEAFIQENKKPEAPKKKRGRPRKQS